MRYEAKRRGAKLPKQYDKPFEEIQFFPDRLYDSMLRNSEKALKIFVGSMTDISYWDFRWVEEVIDRCYFFDQHTFMFLTKDYTAYDGFDWPSNTMQGVTIECDKEILPQKQIINTFARIKNRRPFLSIEPLLGTLKVKIPEQYELVICGPETGKGALPPKPEWVESVKQNVPASILHWKK
jgi:protein gp37